VKTGNKIGWPLLVTALVGASAFGTPARAQTDVEKLNSAVERLLKRVEQLEAANKRLEEALEKSNAEKAKHANREQASQQQVKDLTERVDDVEGEVVALKKPSKVAEALEGVTVGASVAMVSQNAVGGDVTQDSKSQLNYRADVEVEIPLDTLGKLAGVGDSKLFFHLRAGQGEGLSFASPTLTATTNSTAFFLQNSDDSAFILGQAWYQFDYPLTETASGTLPSVQGTLGKIDLFGFFDQNEIADSETDAFLNNVFVHNPLLDSGGAIGGDSYGFQPGLIAAYTHDINSVNRWKASLGVFASGAGASFNSSFSKPFVIGQWEYGGRVLLDRPGNYRLYAWTNGSFAPYNDEFATSTGRESGFGLSIDQEVARHLTVFTRYGHSFAGDVRFDNAITVGAQLGGYNWGRQEDRVGLAYGWLNTSSGFRTAAPTLDADGDGVPDFGYSPTGAESDIELYYAWQVNKNLQLSPNLQWIIQPGGDPSAKNIRAIGLRAVAGF
jgi:hypothetical protein